MKKTFREHHTMAAIYVTSVAMAVILRVIYFTRVFRHIATPVGFVMSDIFLFLAIAMTIRLHIEVVGTGFATEKALKAKAAAEQANEAKTRFLANMSHEIRTPINAVLGMDEMILKKSHNKEIIEYAGDIRSAGEGLLALINDILDISKIESGEMTIVDADYETGELFNGLEKMFILKAAEKGLSFRLEVDGRIPKILNGDIMRVRQICTNLLSNAIKYTDKGNVIMKVSWERIKDGSAVMIFTVQDTGRGIKQEDIDNLFDKFSRADLENNNTIEGTGLGLAITKELVEMMHGGISVKSNYGTGSVFTVRIRQGVHNPEPIGDFRQWIPIEEEAAKSKDNRFIAPDATILAVDDTELNLKVVKGFLSDMRAKVDVALSGQECLEKVKHINYDLIFLDARMPNMDGKETLRRLRKQGLSKKVPVIVFTADAISGASERYLKAGFDGYISKPVRPEKLERIVKEFLPADKILPWEEPDIDNDGDFEQETFMEKASHIEGVDVIKALDMCGSEETFVEIAEEMAAHSEDTVAELGGLFTSGDIEGFTVKVHAMKSSLRLIGVMELSELAESLEHAGDNGDVGYISENLAVLLGGYMKLMNQVQEAAEPNTPAMQPGSPCDIREMIDTETVPRIFAHLKEYVDDFNDEAVGAMLKSLSRYDFPGREQERYELLVKAHDAVDWEKMSELLSDEWAEAI